MTGKELIMKAQCTVSINVPKVAYLINVLFILFVGMAMTGCAGPLHTAAGKGDIGKVRELLAQGADVNAKQLQGWTPLHLAGSNKEIIEFLISKGADVNAKDNADWTPLMWEAYKGSFNSAKLLIEKGADIDGAIARLESASFPKNTTSALAGKNWLIKYQTALASQKPAAGATPVLHADTLDARPATPIVKSDVDELPAIKAKPNKNSYAIVIGIESYRQKLPKADYAVADAKTMTEYLTKAMGYPEENVVTLTNEHAAKSDFEKYFEKWLWNNVEKDSSVFIYYSGHGAPNPKSGDAYLVPYDGDPAFIDETGYSLKRMYAALGKLPAKEVIVALDSCFSGAGGRSVIAKGSRPLVMNLQSNVVLPKNMTVLSASSGDQTSSTYDEKGHGLFTYFMLKGIKNEDVTRADGSLKIDDLYSYVKPQVERIARKQYNNEQTPQLIQALK